MPQINILAPRASRPNPHRQLRDALRSASRLHRLHIIVPVFDTASHDISEEVAIATGDDTACSSLAVFHWIDFRNANSITALLEALSRDQLVTGVAIASIGRLSAFRLGDSAELSDAIGRFKRRSGAPVFAALSYAPKWLRLFAIVDGQFSTPTELGEAVAGGFIERQVARCLDELAA